MKNALLAFCTLLTAYSTSASFYQPATQSLPTCVPITPIGTESSRWEQVARLLLNLLGPEKLQALILGQQGAIPQITPTPTSHPVYSAPVIYPSPPPYSYPQYQPIGYQIPTPVYNVHMPCNPPVQMQPQPLQPVSATMPLSAPLAAVEPKQTQAGLTLPVTPKENFGLFAQPVPEQVQPYGKPLGKEDTYESFGISEPPMRAPITEPLPHMPSFEPSDIDTAFGISELPMRAPITEPLSHMPSFEPSDIDTAFGMSESPMPAPPQKTAKTTTSLPTIETKMPATKQTSTTKPKPSTPEAVKTALQAALPATRAKKLSETDMTK